MQARYPYSSGAARPAIVAQPGARLLHVPYKGDIPALQDTLAGQEQFAFIPAAAALPHVQTGALRALDPTRKADFDKWGKVIREAGIKPA